MDYEPHHHQMMMDSVQKVNPGYGQYSQQSQLQLQQQPKKSLGLLAEVAITRLIEEQKNEAALSSSSKTKIINRIYSLKQIRKLSEKKLLMTFAERLKSAIDKNHKLFSYKCQILPAECQMKYEYRGVGADDEAVVKNRMVDHLLGHLCNLEKSLPNIKISSSRKVKSRNRTAKKVIGGPAKATTSSRVTARKGSSSSGGSRTTKVKVESPTTTITIQQQSVITSSAAGSGTPLDMSTTSVLGSSGSSTAAATASSGPMSSPYSEDKKMLVLKFFEEDHSYTMSASAQPQQQPQTQFPSPQSITTSTSPSQSQQIQLPSVVDHHHYHHNQQQEGSTRLLNEALTTSSTTTSMEHYQHPSVITPNISQTVEIRTSIPQQQQQQMMIPVSSMEPAASSTPASNIRALALDYIDDIRKKSSSAAKSIIVNGDKSLIYQCKICPDKQFTSTNGLIFHYKKHAGLKPYVCELCSATFTRQHSLNYHMLIHLNKSRFVCSECGRHFRHPSHFKEHMRRHTGETPFQCADCLIRFKTRNTYKRHLQTKHAKILTSKGIIELSNTVPYQSAPRAGSANNNTNTTSSVSSGLVSGTGTPTPAVLLASSGVGSVVAGSTMQLGPIGTLAAPGSPVSGVSIKPRRKYGIRFLHKNIEAMSKYDQQVPVAGTITEQQLPTVPLDYSQHHHHLASSQSGITIQGHQVATSPSGQNITILSIPSHAMHAGMNTVHILDNTGANGVRLGKPLVDLTDNVNYSHGQQPGQAITLVSYQPAVNSNNQQQSTVVSSVPSAIEPIQPVLSSPTSVPISTGHLTELTSSPAMMTFSTLTPAAGSAGAGALGQQQVHEQQQAQPQNENFMRLLEAIALTENP